MSSGSKGGGGSTGQFTIGDEKKQLAFGAFRVTKVQPEDVDLIPSLDNLQNSICKIFIYFTIY